MVTEWLLNLGQRLFYNPTKPDNVGLPKRRQSKIRDLFQSSHSFQALVQLSELMLQTAQLARAY